MDSYALLPAQLVQMMLMMRLMWLIPIDAIRHSSLEYRKGKPDGQSPF